MVKLGVIGSRGLVGAWLLRSAQEKGLVVVGASRPEVDVCNVEQLRAFVKKTGVTHLINCAAYTDVDGAEKDPETAFAINAQGAEHCALVAQESGVKLLHISTDYVFGGEERQTPYRETDPCAPINVYGQSKREGELRVQAACPSACIVRTSWLFGGNSKNLISSLSKRFLTDKQIRVVSDQVGKPTYCGDLVGALFTLLEAQGIIHFSNAHEGSRYAIAQVLLQRARERGLPVVCEEIVPIRSAEILTPARRPAYSVLDTQLYTALTGIQIRPWEECLHGL